MSLAPSAKETDIAPLSPYNYEDEEEEHTPSEVSSAFWDVDLVWPDPEEIFEAESGIKPICLATRIAKDFVKGRSLGPPTRCERAMDQFRTPRPTDLPWNVVIIKADPPSVDHDELEEFLVHDSLFVEFFNAFLALPSFPEPISFNVETGGFEVVSDGKQKLSQQIKEAVRSQNLTAKMYRVARQHAFSTIPLIPIEDSTEGPDETTIKIDTSYQVTTLNKDQGIYWIRAERLPIFLESDFYFTYRLAKVISQAKLFNDKGEFVVMKLDYTPRIKKIKTSVEVPPPKVEDIIVKEMYVSFGNVRGEAKEAWFTEAKDYIQSQTTFTSLQPKVTPAITGSATNSDHQTSTNKPLIDRLQRSSVFHSAYFGVYTPGLCGPGETEPPIEDESLLKDRLFKAESERPFTPRPSYKSYASTEKLRHNPKNVKDGMEVMVSHGALVKMWPKQAVDQDSESGIGEGDEKDEELEKRMLTQQIIDQLYNDGTWESDRGNITLKSVDDMGSVIVGAVMKKTLADMLGVSQEILSSDPLIKSLYPEEDLTCISTDNLDLCVVDTSAGKKKDKKKKELKKETADAAKDKDEKKETGEKKEKEPKDSTQENMAKEKGYSSSKPETRKTQETEEDRNDTKSQKEPPRIMWDKPVNKPAEEESDADSLLDSDEDFEERDVHFRRNKHKWHSLSSLKGILSFREFLKGTPGEKYWALWIDIDKGRLISDEEDERQFINNLRERYYRQGAYYELSAQDKKKLGLDKLDNWVPAYLFQVHAKILEPLVLYWAPRYLLKHIMVAEPEKHEMYRLTKSLMEVPQSDPFPHTQALLPLRPKTCCPRTRDFEPTSKVLPQRAKTAVNRQEVEFATTPKVGNRRVYGEDTLQRLALTPTAKYLGLKPPAQPAKTRIMRTPVDRSASRASVTVDDKSGPTKRRSRAISSVSNQSAQTVKSDSKPSFLGKLPGFQPRSQPSEQDTRQTQALESKQDVASQLGPKKPCPCKPLDSIIGSMDEDSLVSPDSLAPAKKPRDLLTPMLRIKDTKNTLGKRIASAPTKRSKSREDSSLIFYRQDSQDSSKVCDPQRPVSVPADAGEPSMQIANIRDCDLMGSDRLEFLLQALHHEGDSGKTFRKYIEKSGKSIWLDNLDFWEMVQQYRQLFYIDKLDLFAISKKAKAIFAKFIVEGGQKNIGVSESIELQVMQRMSPAFEDLFDEAEEHALKVLFECFQLYLRQDVKTYCKVERAETLRHLETRNTYILNLQKKGIIKERPLTPDDPMQGYVDPVYDESLLERIPERFRDWNLDKLLHHRIELEHFRLYLVDNYAEMDLKCWMDIEGWRRTPPQDIKKRDQKAKDIRKNYLNKKYFFGPSSPAGKEGQNKVMEVGGGWGKFLEEKPASASILEAQKYVQERLEKKHLPLFLLTPEFQTRQSPKHSMVDSVDDVVTQKKRRSQAVLKMQNQVHEKAFERLAHLLEEKYGKEPSIGSEASSISSSRKSSLKKVNFPTHPKLPDINLAPLDLDYILRTLLESKWVSSAKEVFMFQRALNNTISCTVFQKYVATRGDNLENDLLFWVEVQNYKRMHHTHTEDAMLAQKITAIIHCFIDSAIPPSLQIDIPQEMADRILDHKHEKGPYLFREAQLACFRILLSHWPSFVEFRNNMDSDERAMKTLERHRLLARKKEQEHRDKMEKQKEKEEKEQQALLPRSGKKSIGAAFKERLLRIELGLGENDDLPEDLFEDEEDKGDKITFSYSGYLDEMQKYKYVDTESFDIMLMHDNTSQTIRSTDEKSQDIGSRRESDVKSLLEKSGGEGTEKRDSQASPATRRGSTALDKRRSSQMSAGNSKEPEESPPQDVKEKKKTLKSRPSSGKSKQHTAGTVGMIEKTEDSKQKRPPRPTPPIVRLEMVE